MNANSKHEILIITDTFIGMAGSERNISQLLYGLDIGRFHVHLACICSGGLAQTLREQGYSVHDLRPGGIYTPNGFRNLFLLSDLIRENNISLIVTYHEASDFYGLTLAKIHNIPIISSRRDMGFKTGRHHKFAYKLVGRYFDRIITVCQAVKQEMIKLGWFPAQLIYPIYNGVDLNIYNANNIDTDSIKMSIGIKKNHQVVGIVANMRKVKGIQYYIEAASLINNQKSDVTFVIIGGDSPNPGYTLNDMKMLAEKYGNCQNIVFLGKRDDIQDLIAIFDVAVVASLSEGFSNTIIEYMASSKPVVATRVGGNAEAVLHERTGMLVPPADAQALADAIMPLLQNKAIAIRYGAEGRKRVEEQFSLDKMIKNYETVFEDVIVQKHGVL
jgi:L-malate glycosyltransferase